MTAASRTRPRILVCKVDNFGVDYSINPWMKPEENDPELASRQWHDMLAVLQKHADIEIANFPDDAPQEIFWTRDGYGVIDGKIVLAQFAKPERQPETAHYRQWFADRGYETVEASTTFEGGNIVHHGPGVYYVGIGDRAESDDPAKLSQQFGVEFVGLDVTSNHFFHLDVAMLSLGDHLFYYPGAFTSRAQAIIKKRIPNAQELSESEMLGFCANSIAIGDTVIIPANQHTFRAKLESIGKQVVEVDLSAFLSIGGGGVHCLTNTLPVMIG